ncbi:MAG: hypothetical protein GY816_03905 [Cytophagales bacterium]|nr:hypothetical protein [Cytophagales bacterium]
MEIIVKYENNRIVPYHKGLEIDMNASPYLIFLATTGMCSAVFVRAFFQQRGLSHEEVTIIQQMKYNHATNHVDEIDIHISLPEGFPVKYTEAVKRVVDQCPVKQHLVNPPKFNVIPELKGEIVERNNNTSQH